MRKNDEFGKGFIEILEIIYAIIFACGIAQMLEEIFVNKSNNIHPLEIIPSAIINIFILIRFFFAPSKNVKVLVTKSKKRKWIMPVDILVLMTHSFIFYLMCLEIKNLVLFYQLFFLLLAVNAGWLFTIRLRLKRLEVQKEQINYMKIWSENNIICVAIYLLSLALYYNPYFNISKLMIGIIWFILALTNSWWDLFKTYDSYFSAD